MSNFADKGKKEERKHEANVIMGKFYLDLSKGIMLTAILGNIASVYQDDFDFSWKQVYILVTYAFGAVVLWKRGCKLIYD